MRLEDVEIELHSHLYCSHQWTYKHWTWLHSSATDTGFSPVGGPLYPAVETPTYEVTQLAQRAAQYRGPADARAIRRVSRMSTDLTFRWCWNQVEKGFTGYVVPACHYGEVPSRSKDSLVDSERILEWINTASSAWRA